MADYYHGPPHEEPEALLVVHYNAHVVDETPPAGLKLGARYWSLQTTAEGSFWFKLTWRNYVRFGHVESQTSGVAGLLTGKPELPDVTGYTEAVDERGETVYILPVAKTDTPAAALPEQLSLFDPTSL